MYTRPYDLMAHKPITLVATIAGEDRTLSYDGKMPWNIREEKKHFSTLASGQPVIIGREAFEAEVRDLERSKVIVLTRDIHFSHMGASVAYSIEDALQKAPLERTGDHIVVAGGAETFTEFLPLAHTIELTMIHKRIAGDLFFPEIPEFSVTNEESVRSGRTNLSFVTLTRERGVDQKQQ